MTRYKKVYKTPVDFRDGVEVDGVPLGADIASGTQQANIVELTDSTGGDASDTIAAATNIATLTDSTGGVKDNTLDAVALTNNTAGAAADGVLEALPNPTDTPADADALRDDLVATLLPALRNNFTDIHAELGQANNNFAELAEELAAQRTLNTVLINGLASLAAKVNALNAAIEAFGITADS